MYRASKQIDAEVLMLHWTAHHSSLKDAAAAGVPIEARADGEHVPHVLCHQRPRAIAGPHLVSPLSMAPVCLSAGPTI